MFIILVTILLVDFYAFKGILRLTRPLSGKPSGKAIHYSFWIITILFLTGLLIAFLSEGEAKGGKAQRNMYLYAGLLLSFYLPKMIFIGFHFAEDLIRLVSFLVHKLSGKLFPSVSENSLKISRSKFLTQTGIIVSAIPFGTLLFGMIHGKFRFRIYREKIQFPDLPGSFNGLKIVHISDIHIGSFYGSWEKIEAAIDMINAQKPDLIFFTGDLVNDFAEELDGWMEILGKLDAGMGKYSVLGNHDYGDYHYWESDAAKNKNLDRIKQAHDDLGFNLLLNQSDILTLGDEKMAIVGVENWGQPPFAQYGDLPQALKDTEKVEFRILLSHDPSHWDAEILKETDIQLTLSGHTHGMQFGIQTGNISWSPIKMKYPQWGGLYESNGQYLYVNRGFGVIGYPGRVGMPPEITVIELFKQL